MAFRGVNVPLARVWILLSYRDNRDKFSRSWKTLTRTQWILLAFNSLKERKKERHLKHYNDCLDEGVSVCCLIHGPLSSAVMTFFMWVVILH